MGQFQFGVPEAVLGPVRRHTTVRTAVETGTFRGDSTMVLARYFDHVVSCEPEPGPLTIARRRVRSAGLSDRVRLVEGDSAHCLPALLADLTGPALFWFDAHWSPWMPANERPQTPVRAELDSVASWPHAAGSVVLVDDAFLFRDGSDDPRHRSGEWPGYRELLDRMSSVAGHRVELVGDVLVAAPDDVPRLGPVVARPRRRVRGG